MNSVILNLRFHFEEKIRRIIRLNSWISVNLQNNLEFSRIFMIFWEFFIFRGFIFFLIFGEISRKSWNPISYHFHGFGDLQGQKSKIRNSRIQPTFFLKFVDRISQTNFECRRALELKNRIKFWSEIFKFFLVLVPSGPTFSKFC